ncbi:hypothetical protein DL765_009312 [Monosporascus sp. GIB2]|nr:hypothetical protein DL765_009312 [Monosporascus sp. GIB2]
MTISRFLLIWAAPSKINTTFNRQLHSHLLIQPNDDIFDEAFNRVVSRDIDETTSAENDAFAFGHTATITAVQDGKNVEIKAITVGQIAERVDGSEPQLRIERIVFAQA